MLGDSTPPPANIAECEGSPYCFFCAYMGKCESPNYMKGTVVR